MSLNAFAHVGTVSELIRALQEVEVAHGGNLPVFLQSAQPGVRARTWDVAEYATVSSLSVIHIPPDIDEIVCTSDTQPAQGTVIEKKAFLLYRF